MLSPSFLSLVLSRPIQDLIGTNETGRCQIDSADSKLHCRCLDRWSAKI